MASGAGPTLPHRDVANIRGPVQGGQAPGTPHTPPRNIPATYGSPSTIRADDDFLVLEIGSRFIRAGFAGDSLPKATLPFGPEQQRRVGDFRVWQTSSSGAPSAAGHAWSDEHEIWQYDLRKVDVGLVHDKLDRLLREAFTKYLLLDSKPRRTAIVLDSAVPLPLLSTVLDTMFDNYHAPMVSLLSSATMSAVSAGVRSALVVNLGWSETVVTSVYEYREVKATRTIRGGRYLINDLYKKVLQPLLRDNDSAQQGDEKDGEENNTRHDISFEESEDIMCRLMWCRPSVFRRSQRDSAQLETVEEQDESEDESGNNATPSSTTATHIPLRSTDPPRTVEVGFESLANVCDDVFFDTEASPVTFDDHELPVHLLVYQHLAQLPIDVRAICMPRIIFTGGSSNILGLKERILDEVTGLVDRRGWEGIPGQGGRAEDIQKAERLRRNTASSPPSGESSPPSASASEGDQSPAPSSTADAEAPYDAIEAKIMRHREHLEPIQGKFRALNTLGPWAGASLMCQLKISAMATIDRDLWSQQGPSGASRPSEVDFKAQQRHSMGAGGLIRGGGGSNMTWTLGTWGAV